MFCTYQYLRKDGTPYYVGKGNETRPYSKWRNVARPQEDARILVQFWESEEKAFEMEKWWIAFWGRKDIGTGILRNFTDGGQGTSGLVQSEAKREKCRQSYKRQLAQTGHPKLGYVTPDDVREKIALPQRGVLRGPNPKIKVTRAKQVMTDQHKEAIRQSCLRAVAEGRMGKLSEKFILKRKEVQYRGRL